MLYFKIAGVTVIPHCFESLNSLGFPRKDVREQALFFLLTIFPSLSFLLPTRPVRPPTTRGQGFEAGAVGRAPCLLPGPPLQSRRRPRAAACAFVPGCFSALRCSDPSISVAPGLCVGQWLPACLPQPSLPGASFSCDLFLASTGRGFSFLCFFFPFSLCAPFK